MNPDPYPNFVIPRLEPIWFSVGPMPSREFAILSSTSDGRGIEALVVMLREDMDKFEQDRSIMAHASSNPSILVE